MNKTTDSTKYYAVYADYFESGNSYEIYRTAFIQQAHMVAQAAERKLTPEEREVFGYTIRTPMSKTTTSDLSGYKAKYGLTLLRLSEAEAQRDQQHSENIRLIKERT